MSARTAQWAYVVGLVAGAGLMCALLQALAAALDGPPARPPLRFAAARTVVRGDATLLVDTAHVTKSATLPEPRALPPALVRELGALGPTVADRTFAVRAAGGPAGLVGHPWSTAALGRYRLTAGRAPAGADEVAASGSWAAPGATLRTGQGGTLHVVGTVTAPHPGFEDALFFTDARAAQISPPIRQLAVDADPAAVRRAVRDSAPGATVLAGPDRREADPDAAADKAALTGLDVVLGTAAGVTGFVALLTAASTSALAVASRRREFGLLRLAGATAGQLRRRVLGGQLLRAVPAAAAGCVLGGAYGARWLGRWTVDGGLAPGWFAPGGGHLWPYAAAFGAGLAAALCGGAAASWRAGRTTPVEALREADAESRALTPARAAAGTALLLTAAALTAYTLRTDPADLLHRKSYVSRPLLLVTATATLTPALVGPLLRVLAPDRRRLPVPRLVGPLLRVPARGVRRLPVPRLVGPLPRVPPPGAPPPLLARLLRPSVLVRAQLAAAARRTAAAAGPVAVAVALAGSLAGAVLTVDAAKAAEIRRATTADLVLTAAGGLDGAALDRIRATPGVGTASAATATTVFTLEDGVALLRSEAWAVDPATLPRTLRLPVVAGDMADLDDDSVAVTTEWRQHTVGRSVTLWLADGTRRTLRVAVVLAAGTGGNGVYLTPRNAPPGAAPGLVRLRLRPGAPPAAVAAALRRAVPGAVVRDGAAWVRTTAPHPTAATRLGLALTLGIALLYAALALATTLVMSTAARARDLTLLRLSGATRLQVLRLTAAQSLLVTAVGTLLGLLVAALDLATLHAALACLAVPAPYAFPWRAAAGTATVCAATAVAASVTPAALLLRRP